MNWETDDFEHRTRYRLLRTGFAFCALGLALMSLDATGHLGFIFTLNQQPHQLHQLLQKILFSPEWEWGVGATITWSTLLGPFLLWGRWREPYWQRRAGLLLLLNLVDVGIWFARYGHRLGLWEAEVGHFWLRQNVLMGASWVQFALFSSLAADVSAHLGSKLAGDAALRARALATAGGVLWLLWFLNHTAWGRWPLVGRHWTHVSFLMWIGLNLLRLVTSFQAAVLCLAAARDCSAMLRELMRSYEGHDVLSSRSDAAADDFWKPPGVDPWR